MYQPKPSAGISRHASKSKPIFSDQTFSSGSRNDTPQWNVEDLRLPSPGSHSNTTQKINTSPTTSPNLHNTHVNPSMNHVNQMSASHKSSNRVYPPVRESDDINKANRHEATTRNFNEINNASHVRKKWENGEANRGHFFTGNNKGPLRRDEVPDELLARTRMQNNPPKTKNTVQTSMQTYKRNTSKTRITPPSQDVSKSTRANIHETQWSKIREGTNPLNHYTNTSATTPLETTSQASHIATDLVEEQPIMDDDIISDGAKYSASFLLSIYLKFKRTPFESIITMVAEEYPPIVHTSYDSNPPAVSNPPVLSKPYPINRPNKGYEETQPSTLIHEDLNKSRNIDTLKSNFTEFFHRSHKRYVPEAANKGSSQWTGSRNDGKSHYSPRLPGGDFDGESSKRVPDNQMTSEDACNYMGESCIPVDYESAESREPRGYFRHPLSCDPFPATRNTEYHNKTKQKQDHNNLPGLACYIESSVLDESSVQKDMSWNEFQLPNTRNMFPIGQVDNTSIPQHPIVESNANAKKGGFYNIVDSRSRLSDEKPEDPFYLLNEKHEHAFQQGNKMFLEALKAFDNKNQMYNRDNGNAFNDPRVPFLEHMLNAVYPLQHNNEPSAPVINDPKPHLNYPEDILSQFQSNDRRYVDPLVHPLGASRNDVKGRNDIYPAVEESNRTLGNRCFNPLDQVWYYKDPSGMEHGPFSSKEMREWWKCNYFSLELRMRLERDAPWLPFALLFPPGGPEPFTFFPSLEQLQRRIQHILLEDGVQLLNASKEKASHQHIDVNANNNANRWNNENSNIDVSNMKEDTADNAWVLDATKQISETISHVQMPNVIPKSVIQPETVFQEQPTLNLPKSTITHEKKPQSKETTHTVQETPQAIKEAVSTKPVSEKLVTTDEKEPSKKKREKSNKNEAKNLEKHTIEDSKPQHAAKSSETKTSHSAKQSDVKTKSSEKPSKGSEKSKSNKLHAQNIDPIDESGEPWHHIKGKNSSKSASKPVVESHQPVVQSVSTVRESLKTKSSVSHSTLDEDEYANNGKGAQPTVVAPWVNAVVRSNSYSLKDVMEAQQKEQVRQMDEQRRKEEERLKEVAHLKPRPRGPGWYNNDAEEEHKKGADNLEQREFPQLGVISSGSLSEQNFKEELNAGGAKGKHSRGSTQSLQEFLSSQAKSSNPVVHSAWATGALQASLTAQNHSVSNQTISNTAAPPIVGKSESGSKDIQNNVVHVSPRMPESDSIPPCQIEEWKQLLESCSLTLDIPIIEYLATLPTPDDVEEFLQEDFPDHRHLRLFADNFVLINCKYAQYAENNGASNNNVPIARASKGKAKKKKNQGRTLDPSMLGFSVKSRGIGGSLD